LVLNDKSFPPYLVAIFDLRFGYNAAGSSFAIGVVTENDRKGENDYGFTATHLHY
jgi:hypothetical protein